ncbi:MAG: TIGR00730 family Rossman fold protein [Prevotella sp.]|nr:TIGR00730 family Rossman fold protein [Prevotella sp.]MCI7787439.1 TIGR00730 family Rossman fold protein [Prevotella sp.]MDD5876583.1 TIGR00730 family Rossman fold protein [Prevotellaceae bacterium]MDY5947528.1 TIGR00730 family Rossman fold protein [Prevotella sp.]
MNICVFCSANDVAPQYVAAAEKLGRWLGREGHTLVYGGANLGLMEAVARAAHEAGATVVGVVPAILEKTGRASDHIDVRVLCDSLDDRKAIMVERSDLFVALPGGVGTLDEIFTVVAAASIGYHHKRVVLLNIDGFWDSLLAMLDDLQSKGVLRPGLKETLTVVTEVEKVV